VKSILCFLIIGFLFLTSCVKAPIFQRITEVKFAGINTKTVKLTTTCAVCNPNKKKFNISDINADIFIEGKKIINAKREEPIILKCRDTTFITFETNIQTLDLLKTIPKALFQSELTIDMELEGAVKVIAPRIRIKSQKSLTFKTHEEFKKLFKISFP